MFVQLFMNLQKSSLSLAVAVTLLSLGCTKLTDLLSSETEEGLAVRRFTAVPSQVAPGNSTILTWQVDGAESVEIDNGVGVVGAKGTYLVRPSATTSYRLTARSGEAQATSSIRITVTGTSPSPAPLAAVSPTPAPTASPTPAPTPTPTPAPTPTPTPAAQSCKLPPQPECGGPEGPKGTWGCCKEEHGNIFGEMVEEAIAKIQKERPELFDRGRVLNDNAYVQGVARILERDYGLCSKQGGPEDEIGVKNANNYSEQFDILLGSGYIRYGGHTVNCRPARF